MNKACINYGIEIPNDSKDKRIKKTIEDVTLKDSYKMNIVTTFFNENNNRSFREFLFNNLEGSEKTKHSINSIADLNNETIIKELNLPDGFVPCCAVCLGKTNEIFEEREIPNRISKTFIK